MQVTQVLFENASLFDGSGGELKHNMSVLVEKNRIKAVSEAKLSIQEAEVIDCHGMTLMPGMIDCHVHVYGATLDSAKFGYPQSWYTHYAAKFLKNVIDCGFTTVRDIAGGDVGLQLALEDGFIEGPRYIYGGLALSQTGGHGDLRGPHQHRGPQLCGCGAGTENWVARLVDGVDECLKATREELGKGASHIKIMGSGGVMSPSDPLDNTQFSDEEILAIVSECERQGKYVAAHCHPDHAIRRCVELGVRTIEHGTMISAETSDIVVEHGSYIVPTLSVIGTILANGTEMGVPEYNMDKIQMVADQMFQSLEYMKVAGCKIGFGTDLLAELHTHRDLEFTMRSQVFSNFDILHQATAQSAKLLRIDDQLGFVREGYLADILVVDGNPLEDIGVLAGRGEKINHIMKDGVFHKKHNIFV